MTQKIAVTYHSDDLRDIKLPHYHNSDPDPPLDWSSRAHVYPDEEGKPLIRISLEYSHDSFPTLLINKRKKLLLCIHNHPVFSGLWRVKKIHPGGKVITCYMHREIHLPQYLQNMIRGDPEDTNILENNNNDDNNNINMNKQEIFSPEQEQQDEEHHPQHNHQQHHQLQEHLNTGNTIETHQQKHLLDPSNTNTSMNRLPPINGSTSPMPPNTTVNVNNTNFTDTNGNINLNTMNTMEDKDPKDYPYWDVELHPDKSLGEPQNITLVHRIPLKDDSKHSKRKKTTVSFAPPLLFQTKVEISNIWKIDPSNQVYCAELLIDSRLKSIVAGELDGNIAQEAINELFMLYEIDPNAKLLEVRDAEFTEYAQWSELLETHVPGKYDYHFKLRCKGFFNQRLDTSYFPYDSHNLSIRVSLHIPRRYGAFVLDLEKPSTFLLKNYRMSDLWMPIYGDKILCNFDYDLEKERIIKNKKNKKNRKIEKNDNGSLKKTDKYSYDEDDEDDYDEIYGKSNLSMMESEATFITTFRRNPNYVLYNAIIPTVVIAILGVFAYTIGNDSNSNSNDDTSNSSGLFSSMYIGERMSVLVLLILTSIFLKGLVLTQVSIPAVNMTLLDIYCNNTISCLVLNIIIISSGLSDMLGIFAYLLILFTTFAFWTRYYYVSLSHKDQTYKDAVREEEERRKEGLKRVARIDKLRYAIRRGKRY